MKVKLTPVSDTVSCDRCHKVIATNAFFNCIQAGVDVEVSGGTDSQHKDVDVHFDCCDECASWPLGEFGHKG
jgi:hypothetical protein